ncbi:hypothetical protein HW532_00045 [Kaustia mangrovi]|uniref:Uncharacterized protein n=1 Tax=Kaustia mangrovi TaxID=2593653 RepID=A0A7S8C0Y0_9HYPH|nr:hypothetical protein [Kaustia mangrovi]QPC41272.1 hypothetical protein HW532_00045 [Kaustia mangrovi]
MTAPASYAASAWHLPGERLENRFYRVAMAAAAPAMAEAPTRLAARMARGLLRKRRAWAAVATHTRSMATRTAIIVAVRRAPAKIASEDTSTEHLPCLNHDRRL